MSVTCVWLALAFAAAALFANVFPFADGQRHADADCAASADRLVARRRRGVRRRPMVHRRAAHGLREILRRAVHLLRAHRARRRRAHRLHADDVQRHRDERRMVGSGLAGPVRRDGRRHRRILAGGGEAERHREHGARADEAVHAAIHRRAAGVSGHDGVDGQPHRREARSADRVRPVAGAGRWPRALRRLGARLRKRRPISSTGCSCCWWSALS